MISKIIPLNTCNNSASGFYGNRMYSRVRNTFDHLQWLVSMLNVPLEGILVRDLGDISENVKRGVNGLPVTSANASAAAVSVTDAPISGQKIVLTDIIISTDVEMVVDLKEETSGTVLAKFYMGADSTTQFTPRGKFKLAVADKKLQVQTSATGNISVLAIYQSEY
jgi:hypothetical protein